MNKSKKICLLEDDRVIGAELCDLLQAEGFAVVWFKSLAEARSPARDASFDLALFDVNLPDGTSFDLCREMRDGGNGIPIVFLTARTDENSAVRGLSLADCEYLRKPFHPRELVLRIRKLLKERKSVLEMGSLTLDPSTRTLLVDGTSLSVTPTEFQLLYVLAQHPNAVVPKEVVLAFIDPDATLDDRSLRTHFSRLRTKLKDAAVRSVEITAVYGSGYRLQLKAKREVA